MLGPMIRDSNQLISEHQTVLREYAKRAILGGESLPYDDQKDKRARMGEFLAIGNAFGLTCRDMVGQLYRGLLCPVSDDSCIESD